MLVPHIPYNRAETVQSYAARLSLIHTGQRASRLLEDCGVKPARFGIGHVEEIARFAEAAGVEIGVLLGGTIRALSRHNSFRDEDVSRQFLSPRVRQFCPHCLREDGPASKWHHRIVWCFSSIPICQRHGATLVELDDDAGDIGEAVEHAGGLEAAEALTQRAEGGRHLAWLHRRLDMVPDTGWLDGQTLEQVLNASEMLGIVLEHGQDIRPVKLPRMERSRSLEIGFRIYEQGSDAVYAALGDIRRKASATAVHAGPLAMYGPLYDWLDRRSQLIAPGPIRDILREHILDHDAYMQGEKLLGEVVTERRLHSVKSLALTLKVDRRRMSRLLQKLGLVPEGATDGESGRLVFPVAEVEQLVGDYETAIPLAEVPEYVGGTQSQTLALYRAGILPAVIPADAPGAVRGVIFARRVLNDLLARIGALPLLENGHQGRALTIAEACQRHGGRTDDLTRAVLLREIPGYRISGEPRLHGLRVFVSDILATRQVDVVGGGVP